MSICSPEPNKVKVQQKKHFCIQNLPTSIYLPSITQARDKDSSTYCQRTCTQIKQHYYNNNEQDSD